MKKSRKVMNVPTRTTSSGAQRNGGSVPGDRPGGAGGVEVDVATDGLIVCALMNPSVGPGAPPVDYVRGKAIAMTSRVMAAVREGR
jgi:hypothetical protein